MKKDADLQNHQPSREVSISYLERRWLLYILDVLGLCAGFLLSFYFRDNPEWLLFLVGVWLVVGHLFQVYDIEKASKIQTAYLPVLSAGLITVVFYNLVPYIPPTLPPSRQPLFITLAFPVLFILLGRSLYLAVFGRSRFRRRLLILGAGWAGKTIFKALNEHGKSLYQLVGFVDDQVEKLGTAVDVGQEINQEMLTHPASLTVIGRQDHLLDLVQKYRVTTVVLAITEDIPGALYQRLADCLQHGIEIVPMTVLYEELTGKVPVEHIGDQWSVSMPLEHPGTKLTWEAAKRGFDLVWSSFGLVTLALLFPVIALAIKLDSKGPIFYRQERVGRHGRKFTVYKFRSMIVGAEQDQEVWAQKGDSRITRVGKLLRMTHVDEFPQFWNIFVGEMSVVGPRPERPEFVEQLAGEIPFYRVRLAVKPGMAGWALIHQGYGGSIEDTLIKLQYDLYYIKHQSLWLDLFILGRTIFDALTLGGR
jgi:exopolysaccharide biosynthesis polyprenyl glycosylphosphotransferase